ncbi:hypothetical protein LUZ60_007813 [Juncus effusus]|nr:hypothetical protein LUZ60_007813 [Juncus effusus]
MAKRVREEEKTQNPREGLRSSEAPPKRGRGRPRKDAASAPPLSQMERRRVNKPSRERLRSLRRNRSRSPVVTPPPAEMKKSAAGPGRCFFKIFFADQSSQKLRIPPAFRQQISAKSVGTVTLKGPSGYKWKVDLVQSSKKEFYFQTGWEIFVSDHSLKTSDMLLFKQEGIRDFSVQVFDKSACEKESAFQANPNQGEVLSPVKPVVSSTKEMNNCLAIVKKEPDDLCDVRPLVYIKPEPLEIAEPPKYFNWLNYTHQQIVEAKPKRVPTIISQRRPVTQAEIDNALERARAFSSENPFLLIVMRNSYVYCSFFMSIRTEFARKHLPRSNTKLTLIDPSGRTWVIQYVCYNSRNGAFSGGWAKASVANNLELNDVVIFELVEKNCFKMHVYRVVDEIAPFKKASKVRDEDD